jgi:hypothetical protein
MWSYGSIMLDRNIIALPDKLIQSALPKAFEELKKQW